MSQGILWAVLTNPVKIAERYPIGEPHHITLMFGVERSHYQHYEGLTFTALATEECWNDRIQALKVLLPHGIPHDANRTPHVTASSAEGVQPVESNAMFNACHNIRIVEIPMECRIEFLEWDA